MKQQRSEVSGQRSEVRGRRTSASAWACAAHAFKCTRPTLAPSHPRHQRGFTLVEMVVVIGIIVLLAAIFLGVATAINRKSETSQMQNVFVLLDSALKEWEVAADRQITYGTNDQPVTGARYDIQEDPTPGPMGGADEIITQRLLQIIARNSGAKAILANIDAKLLKNKPNPNPNPGDPATVFDFQDPWDNPIVTVFPGRKWLGGPEHHDVDGTVRTTFEIAYGECDNGNIFFVSAGPDGEFGDLHLDPALTGLSAPQLRDVQLAADNIYSRPPRRDRAVP